MKRANTPRSPGWARGLRRTVSLLTASLCLMATIGSVPPAVSAASVSDLQKQLEEIQSSMAQHRQELADAKKRENAAAGAGGGSAPAGPGDPEPRSLCWPWRSPRWQNAIGQKQQQITAKQAEIDQKELDIENQWDDFKTFMGAMQELREGGSVAMLSAVTDLYQLLTFNEMMQDISVKETQMLD